ncbi:hypothetical protein DUNSADRAFT_9368 [Dunaliella salina]|uniref:Uncharacterized protein n=1 Tax=Dunaliella salina TaxID=3046 RepID=A0ABQ7H5H5_DUNSA|nr:hypothetical protein DUNSADRAFT_9368 [Dunaliella salina]|eukprot:KAF5842108.1 hypothetical protein DUNSADRAFT_9368 [Dunaliella salina]
MPSACPIWTLFSTMLFCMQILLQAHLFAFLCPAGASETEAKTELLRDLQFSQRDPAEVPAKLAIQVQTIADSWDKIRVCQQGQDVREVLELLQKCWAYALDMQQDCTLALSKTKRERQHQQPKASRGGQRSSSSQRTAGRRVHTRAGIGSALAFEQTTSLVQEILCAWERVVDACAWCVHVILSRLAYPLPYPCMAGFLPLATGTMQELSRPGSSSLRGLLQPQETRSVGPDDAPISRIGGAVAAASVGSYLLELPHPQRQSQPQQQEGPSHSHPHHRLQQQQKQQQKKLQPQPPQQQQQQQQSPFPSHLSVPADHINFLTRACAFTANLRLLVTREFHLIKEVLDKGEVCCVGMKDVNQGSDSGLQYEDFLSSDDAFGKPSPEAVLITEQAPCACLALIACLCLFSHCILEVNASV